jgi:hypothetical protein
MNLPKVSIKEGSLQHYCTFLMLLEPLPNVSDFTLEWEYVALLEIHYCSNNDIFYPLLICERDEKSEVFPVYCAPDHIDYLYPYSRLLHQALHEFGERPIVPVFYHNNCCFFYPRSEVHDYLFLNGSTSESPSADFIVNRVEEVCRNAFIQLLPTDLG